MKIVIAGYGAVGQAIEYALQAYDPDKMDIYIDDPAKGYNFKNVGDPVDGVIVCVATPAHESGMCNTDYVEQVLTKYGNAKYLIKSAVDPVWLDWETGVREGSYTYSPEFLGGSNIHRDPCEEFLNQTFAIYGGDNCRFWDEFFRPVLPKLENVKYCTLQQAAFSKYVENCFLATKVVFFNEMYRIFDDIGFDGFDQMVDAVTLDPRIGRSHTQVPGPDGEFGYGGHCFPKDVAALRYIAKDSPLLDVVSDLNEEIRNAC
jgi:UDPglucose 6-dehydrogenase